MAWRIDEAVVRGEIDNRVRGRVTGRLWLVGREEPVELDLAGNAWRDLAGRCLCFENPEPKAMDLASLEPRQDGAVGDITASRKVKVPDIPMDQIGEYYAAKKAWPWHWGNVLYLEWFSEMNGRVVIESASYELRIEGDATWEMTEAEEGEQREANSRAMMEFFSHLSPARTEAGEAPGEADYEVEEFEGAEEDYLADEEDSDGFENDEEQSERGFPMTEAEAEAFQARQDLLADRVQARIEREGEAADYGQILNEEIERLRRERGEPEPPGEWEPGYSDMDELFEAAEEALEEPDPELEKMLDYKHPLVERASDLFHGLFDLAKTERWLPDDAQREHPVQELIDSTMGVGPKLAGALNGGRWPPLLDVCALTIVRLKRAHGYVDDALAAAEACQEDKLIEARHLGPVVVELIDIAREIKVLIAELRERLGETADDEE